MEKRDLISSGISLFALVLIVLGAIDLFSNLVHSGLLLAFDTGESVKWAYIAWLPRALVFDISRIILGFIILKKHDFFVNWMIAKRLNPRKDAGSSSVPDSE